jgi:hypothetical protein
VNSKNKKINKVNRKQLIKIKDSEKKSLGIMIQTLINGKLRNLLLKITQLEW